jgi:hypothetical protein
LKPEVFDQTKMHALLRKIVQFFQDNRGLASGFGGSSMVKKNVDALMKLAQEQGV